MHIPHVLSKSLDLTCTVVGIYISCLGHRRHEGLQQALLQCSLKLGLSMQMFGYVWIWGLKFCSVIVWVVSWAKSLLACHRLHAGSHPLLISVALCILPPI